MFRKIRSDRDPRDTVLKELRKEFKPQVDIAAGILKKHAERNPKVLFYGMVLSIFISLVLSFFVFRKKKAVNKGDEKVISAPAIKSLDQIFETGRRISRAIALKKEIDSLSNLKKLTSLDSSKLESDLDRLQELTKSFSSDGANRAHQQLPLKINSNEY